MPHQVVEYGDKRILYADAGKTIETLQDGLDLVSACWENHASLLMIPSASLSEAFFHLRTGLAGEILQKWGNYQIKAAAVLSPDQKIQGKFQDFILETNRGSGFRVFAAEEEALAWLTQEA